MQPRRGATSRGHQHTGIGNAAGTGGTASAEPSGDWFRDPQVLGRLREEARLLRGPTLGRPRTATPPFHRPRAPQLMRERCVTLRLTGMIAPMVLDGAIDRDAFQAYVERVLIPD